MTPVLFLLTENEREHIIKPLFGRVKPQPSIEKRV